MKAAFVPPRLPDKRARVKPAPAPPDPERIYVFRKIFSRGFPFASSSMSLSR